VPLLGAGSVRLIAVAAAGGSAPAGLSVALLQHAARAIRIFEWDPRPDAGEAYACRVAGRNFTKAEWDDLFPGQAYRTTCRPYPPGG